MSPCEKKDGIKRSVHNMLGMAAHHEVHPLFQVIVSGNGRSLVFASMVSVLFECQWKMMIGQKNESEQLSSCGT
jgi:hypothetical protein